MIKRSSRAIERETNFKYDPTIDKNRNQENMGLLVSKNLIELKSKMSTDILTIGEKDEGKDFGFIQSKLNQIGSINTTNFIKENNTQRRESNRRGNNKENNQVITETKLIMKTNEKTQNSKENDPKTKQENAQKVTEKKSDNHSNNQKELTQALKEKVKKQRESPKRSNDEFVKNKDNNNIEKEQERDEINETKISHKIMPKNCQISMKEMIKNKLLAKKKAIEEKKDEENRKNLTEKNENGTLKCKNKKKENIYDNQNEQRMTENTKLNHQNASEKDDHDNDKKNEDQIGMKNNNYVNEVKINEKPMNNDKKKLQQILGTLRAQTLEKNKQNPLNDAKKDQKNDIQKMGMSEKIKNDKIINSLIKIESESRLLSNIGKFGKDNLQKSNEEDQQNRKTQTFQPELSKLNKNELINQAKFALEIDKLKNDKNQQNITTLSRLEEIESPIENKNQTTTKSSQIKSFGNVKSLNESIKNEAKEAESDSKCEEIRETKSDLPKNTDSQIDVMYIGNTENVFSNQNLHQSQPSSSDFAKSKRQIKRLLTEEYESMVVKIASLDLRNLCSFIKNPLQPNQVIQCTIVRNKSGLINKFYPIFHIYFSVISLGRPKLSHNECSQNAR